MKMIWNNLPLECEDETEGHAIFIVNNWVYSIHDGGTDSNLRIDRITLLEYQNKIDNWQTVESWKSEKIKQFKFLKK